MQQQDIDRGHERQAQCADPPDRGDGAGGTAHAPVRGGLGEEGHGQAVKQPWGGCSTRCSTRGGPARHDGVSAPAPRPGTKRLLSVDGAGMILALMATIAFFPEGAYGPTNNCAGIGAVLRDRGHRVVFIVEESFAGTLAARGFEERLMRLGPPPDAGRGAGPVLEGLHPRHRAGVPPSDHRAARGVHRADLSGSGRRRPLRRRAPGRDHRRAGPAT